MPAARLVFGNLFLSNDGIQLVAFRRDGEVVAWTVMVRRSRADYSD